MITRGSGVFLNVSSLPSKFAIGGFGQECREWIDKLASMKMKWWQILPLCPVGYGNSPYSSMSAFAINPYYIDLPSLKGQGLLTEEELKAAQYPGTPYAVDYDWVRENKEKWVRRAFYRFTEREKLDEFSKKESSWLDDYSAFMASKKLNQGAAFWQWDRKPSKKEQDYYRFEQYLAHTQWAEVKTYANAHGISLFGDMPIYVLHDSADFWGNQELFLTDKEGIPNKVAGVPPDYFSAEGQLWGNPLYHWKAMEREGFEWWMRRIEKNLKLYDAVRIDHFRGLYQYWAVPKGAKSAKEGHWEDGPGMKLIEKIWECFDSPNIIAEDLGEYSEGLAQFLGDAGFPGMRVMQFGFSGHENMHTPHRYSENVVAYTGTHDNDTLLGWLWATPMEEKMRMLHYCRYFGDNWGEGGPRSEVIRAVITTLWQSSALLAFLPVQDMCGYGTDTRMNIPGKPDHNWEFRITHEALSQIDTEFFAQLNETYARG